MRTESQTGSVRRRLPTSLLLVAVVVGIAAFATPAFAQNMARVKLDFAFLVSGKELPAGSYEFEAAPNRIMIRSTNGSSATTVVPIVTRLGRHDNDADPELVFDKVDGKLLLSELWLPGSDGYLLLASASDHEHRVVGGSRPRK
jgi:hypothetical protein